MSQQFRENALSWGIGGKKWLTSIPSLISNYEKLWSLKVLPPFPLSYNYVAPTIRGNGIDCVLKIGFPKDKEIQSEIKALGIFDGRGCARLLESDPENSVFLIEAIRPGTPLSTLSDDEKATTILAQVMKRLHQPLPKNHSFTTINQWSQAITAYKHRFPRSGPLPISTVNLAQELFLELIESSAPEVLVHGDLHHDNVLFSHNDQWLAIDPKGIAAEPAYEAAAMIRNPYEKLKDVTDLLPLLRQRLLVLSCELEVNPHRLRKWCIAQTVLSAVWNTESTKGSKHALRVAHTLITMKL